MDVEFDPAKDAENVRKHGISLARAKDFDMGTALTKADTRRDYGEVRFRSIGEIEDNLFLLAFTLRGQAIRAISLRVANRKERKQYEKAT